MMALKRTAVCKVVDYEEFPLNIGYIEISVNIDVLFQRRMSSFYIVIIAYQLRQRKFHQLQFVLYYKI